jgi:hypothetical protein
MQPRDVPEGWEDLKEALSLTQGGAVFFVVADDRGDARMKERLRSAGWELVEEEIAVWLDPSSGKPAHRIPEYDALQRRLAGRRNVVLWLRLKGIEAAGHGGLFADRPVAPGASEELAQMARQVLQGINLSREPRADRRPRRDIAGSLSQSEDSAGGRRRPAGGGPASGRSSWHGPGGRPGLPRGPRGSGVGLLCRDGPRRRSRPPPSPAGPTWDPVAGAGA